MYTSAFGHYAGCLIWVLIWLAVGHRGPGASIDHWWVGLGLLGIRTAVFPLDDEAACWD